MKRNSKQDEAEREVAAIRAAMNFLNNGSGYSRHAQSKRLLETTKNQRESKLLSPINGGAETCAYISSEWNSSKLSIKVHTATKLEQAQRLPSAYPQLLLHTSTFCFTDADAFPPVAVSISAFQEINSQFHVVLRKDVV